MSMLQSFWESVKENIRFTREPFYMVISYALSIFFIWFIGQEIGYENFLRAIRENDISGFLVFVGLIFGLDKRLTNAGFGKGLVVYGALCMLIAKLIALSLGSNDGEFIEFSSFFWFISEVSNAYSPSITAIQGYVLGVSFIVIHAVRISVVQMTPDPFADP